MITTMTGLVLCGGGSSRMGHDKGLLKDESQTWAEAAAQKLAGLPLPVLASVNRHQLSAYSPFFLPKQLVVDDEALPVKGPLLGLLSVHQKTPTEDLFALACDIKDMTTSLLQNLYKQSLQSKQEAFVYTSAGKVQPLCGIYTASGLQKIYVMLQAGTLKKFSMMYVLEALDTKYTAVKSEDHSAFKNYNSAGDLGGPFPLL